MYLCTCVMSKLVFLVCVWAWSTPWPPVPALPLGKSNLHGLQSLNKTPGQLGCLKSDSNQFLNSNVMLEEQKPLYFKIVWNSDDYFHVHDILFFLFAEEKWAKHLSSSRMKHTSKMNLAVSACSWTGASGMARGTLDVQRTAPKRSQQSGSFLYVDKVAATSWSLNRSPDK